MVQSPTGLIAPLLRSHIRSSFLDIVLYLLFRTAFYRLVNIPDAAQRWPVPVDALMHLCVDMVVDSMACYKGKGSICEPTASFSFFRAPLRYDRCRVELPLFISSKLGLVVPLEAVLTAS
jgi:hypothetical protein